MSLEKVIKWAYGEHWNEFHISLYEWQWMQDSFYLMTILSEITEVITLAAQPTTPG